MTLAPIEQAMALLERLLVAAETGGRWRSVIEILVLQALAQNAGGRSAAGLDPLGRALALAEAEGYIRAFVSEGAPMADMLANGGEAWHHTGVRSALARCLRTQGPNLGPR